MDSIYKSTSTAIDTINSGSFFSETEIADLRGVLKNDDNFGTNVNDELEYFIYDIDGNLNNSGILPKSDVWNIESESYKSNTGQSKSYQRKKYNNSQIVRYQNILYIESITTIVKQVASDLKNLVYAINFARSVAGTRNVSLKIKEISPSKQEIKLRFDPTKVGTREHREFNAFISRKINVDEIQYKLHSSLKLINLYPDISEMSADVNFEYVKNQLGAKSNVTVVEFMQSVLSGVSLTTSDGIKRYHLGLLEQIRHYCGENADSFVLPLQFETNLRQIAIDNIKHRLSLVKTSDDSKLFEFFYDWIVNHHVSWVIAAEIAEYNKKFDYLVNGLNFGNNQVYPILNYVGDGDEIIVKLLGYLPSGNNIGDKCWISNITRPSLIHKVILDAPIIKRSRKISGPDFTAAPILPSEMGLKSATTLAAGRDDAKNISFYKKLNTLNVDYSEFSNFIAFSSAELRVKLFLNKLISLRATDQTKTNLVYTASISNTAVSKSYSTEYDTALNYETSIFDSFDGYETYLYNQAYIASGSISGNTDLDEYISSSIDYDKANKDSLVNNTPAYVTTDGDNEDYVIFLSMIGHHFDNIYLFVNNFPPLQYATLYSTGSTYVSTLSETLLQSFGWEPKSSFTDDVASAFLTSSFNSVEGDKKSKIIWNRLLQNLPAIYKSKGTEECIRMIANIYGVPYHLLTIKTFGGSNYISEPSSSYTMEDRLYLTKFKRANEYVQLPYETDTGAVEFKLRFDKNVPFENHVPFKIVEKDSAWSIEAMKVNKNECGRLKFNITGSSDAIAIISDELPIFNGELVNVLIKRENTVAASFDSSSYIPYHYRLLVSGYDGMRCLYYDDTGELLSPDYASAFTSSGLISFGNKSDNMLWGNIDKINLWSGSISDSVYQDHGKNINLYSHDTASLTKHHLKFRYTFDYPVDLMSATSIDNKNTMYATTASAYNFIQNTTVTIDCSEWSASQFPYQFDEVDVIQTVNLNGYGPSSLKNTLINTVSESVVSRFSSDSHSTTRDIKLVDSNIVGVYISPIKTRNDDIVRMLGNYNLMADVGSPANLYSSSYDSLAALRKIYNENNTSEKILFNEFLTLYKQYLDSSIFDAVKKVIPTRNKFISGIVIEPSLLERPKYQYRPIQSSLVSDWTSSLNTYNAVEAEMIPSYSASIRSTTSQSRQQRDRLGGDYISSDLTLFRNSCFSINGNFVETGISGSISRSVYVKDFTETVTGNNYITASQSIYRKTYSTYNVANYGTSVINGYAIDTRSYPKEHLSLKRNINRRDRVVQLSDRSIAPVIFKKSSQTALTTVNQYGIQDGSSPIEIASVMRDTTTNSTLNR